MVQNESDILLRETIDGYGSAFPSRLKVVHCLSRLVGAAPHSVAGSTVVSGRIDMAKVKRYAFPPTEEDTGM